MRKTDGEDREQEEEEGRINEMRERKQEDRKLKKELGRNEKKIEKNGIRRT